MSDIIYNAIMTPDGTILESSKFYSERISYRDRSGHEYGVYGALDELGRFYDDGAAPYVELGLFLDDDYEVVRSAPVWTLYDQDGEGTVVSAMEMTVDQLMMALRSVNMHDQIRKLFEMELELRYELEKDWTNE